MSSARSLVISLVMAFAVALVAAVIGTGYGIGGWIRILITIAAGVAVYLGAPVSRRDAPRLADFPARRPPAS